MDPDVERNEEPTMAEQHPHDDEPAIRPAHLGKPEKISDVVRDVTKGVVEFLEGEPLVGDQEREGLPREDRDGPEEGEQFAP